MPMIGGMAMKWYALHVKTGGEELVKKQIIRHYNIEECECCVPKRRVPEKRNGYLFDVTKVMFPGYVFIKMKINFELYYSLKSFIGVYSVVNYSNKIDLNYTEPYQDEEVFFKPIPEEDMSPILSVLNPINDVMEYSTFNLSLQAVKIVSGPLVGQEERIRKIDKRKRRAKLAIDILGEEKLVDIGFEILNEKKQ